MTTVQERNQTQQGQHTQRLPESITPEQDARLKQRALELAATCFRTNTAAKAAAGEGNRTQLDDPAFFHLSAGEKMNVMRPAVNRIYTLLRMEATNDPKLQLVTEANRVMTDDWEEATITEL